MSEISVSLIEEAVYNLCLKANICLNEDVYSHIYNAYVYSQNKDVKNRLKAILQNAKIAYEKKRPLCQDTGQVIVFIELGQEIHLKDGSLENAVDRAIAKCYTDNYFRKSVVKNAIFNRKNTEKNTPSIIYTNIIDGDNVKISVLIKGAGSENKSQLEMMLPTDNEEEIIRKTGNLILNAGINACPPMFIGVGIGGTAEKACLLSKRTFVYNEFSDKEYNLANKIKEYVNSKAPENYENSFVLDIKLLSTSTHIACMPVAVTINCHSDRVSTCYIENNKITYSHKVPNFIDIEENYENIKEVFSNDYDTIRNLKEGEEILLTGEIYTARDMAHQKLEDLMAKNQPLPIDIKNKIIFYAGPCPNRPEEIIGSIGPTTSSRMDKFSVNFYNKGMLASIGKGNRNNEVINAIKNNNAKYFTAIGGVAALFTDKVKSCSIIAFEEFGTEAIYSLYVEKLPLKVSIG